MKILIRGAGFQNKGAEAMLRVVQRELSIRLPMASFYATVTHADALFANRSGVTPVFDSQSTRRKVMNSVPFFAKAYERSLSSKNSDFARAVKTSPKTALEIKAVGDIDGVIDVSGFTYGDTWGLSPLKYAWTWIEYCQVKKKPYIFLPQAWGSFEKPDVSSWAKKVCQSADLVFSRDDKSANYLAEMQNISISDVRNAPDIAFRFKGASLAVGSAILNDLGLSKEGRPVIALVPNMRVYERTAGIGAANQYVTLLVNLVDYCIENLGASVLLAPNEICVPSADGPDDRFLCGIIESRIRQSEHCFMIREYYSSETVKAILGQVDMLIASRFHSLVFALSQGIPSLALGWSHKYRELLRPFGMEGFVVDHDSLDSGSVFSLVASAWEQREISQRQILATVPHLQSKVDDVFDEVAARIREANS